MKHELLLLDESEIDEEDYIERCQLLDEFKKLPDEFIFNIRHFQPQVGCLNICKICSKCAETKVECWTERRIRNVVAAIKYRALLINNNFPLIANERRAHRPGVIFPYLDNDIGNYIYLDKFIKILYEELGVQTRISTIGYSRYNVLLNKMHSIISGYDKYIGGVRLSFTPYGMGWIESDRCSREEYIEDMAKFLSVYEKYYKKVGTGYRKMCIELRYSPLVINSKVWVSRIYEHIIIATKNYLYISRNVNVKLKVARVVDEESHAIELSEPPCYFYMINLDDEISSLCTLKKKVIEFLNKKKGIEPVCELYLMENYEGIYFAINPKLGDEGNFGINIYPCTGKRKNSGYIVTERFLLNAISLYKKQRGLLRLSKFPEATWSDVDNVLGLLSGFAQKYREERKYEKYEYINNVIFPMVKGYVLALKKANYSADIFFDPDFTIDTGIICNLGRALSEFKGLSMKENEPLTPAHERNYGRKNSLMTKEGIVWRISCGYEDTLIIQKLNLSNTASKRGQLMYEKVIQLNSANEILNLHDLESNYFIPGQRRI